MAAPLPSAPDSDAPHCCPACAGPGVVVRAAEIDPVDVLVSIVFRCLECRNEWEVALDQTVQVKSNWRKH
jgi:hypothetical protein